MGGKKSKRGRVGEGRPTKRTPEAVAAISQAIAQGLTDREAGLLAGVRHGTMTEWRRRPLPAVGSVINATTPARVVAP